MKKLSVKVRGTAPLIHHSARLSDPLDDYAKQLKKISARRAKTEADHEAMSKIEFFGSLYHNGNCPIIPAANIRAAMVKAARKNKQGKIAESAVQVAKHAELEYDGPKDAEGLFADSRFVSRASVRVANARTMRTRPTFKEWSATFDFVYDEDEVDEEQVVQWIERAGLYVGIGDWRPEHGRFEIVE